MHLSTFLHLCYNMGRYNLIAILACLLVIQPWTVTPNLLSPLLSPISEAVCKGIDCGKGTCKPSGNLTLYACECNPGWKHAGLSFLPCVIPNCSVDYSCAAASPPAQGKQNRSLSFEPCDWMDCKGGTCNKTSPFTYKCECRADYHNLLNSSAFPCLQECALGMDCKSIGISINNQSSSPPTAKDNTSQASPKRRGEIGWSVMFTILFAPFLLK